jgi:hypothetical protein
MNWPWRKKPVSVPVKQADQGSRYSAEALETFLAQARAMAAWHEARIDAFERKAGTLLGFAGVILVLLPTLRGPIAKAHGCNTRAVLVALAILAAALLALASVCAAFVLVPRKYAAPDLAQLRREWSAYADKGSGHRAPEQVIGLFVDQYVRRADPKSSPVDTLRDDADKRGRWMMYASVFVVIGVVVLASFTSVLLVKGGG